MRCDCEARIKFFAEAVMFFATGCVQHQSQYEYTCLFVFVLTVYVHFHICAGCEYLFVCISVCLSVWVCVCLAEPYSLSLGKSHRFQSLRGAMKKNAAFLRKACASVCMVKH